MGSAVILGKKLMALTILPRLNQAIALLLSTAGLLLSLWIVLPAPVFQLLPLSVGAPEISPWLLVGNAIALLLALTTRTGGWGNLALFFSALALVLSSLPSLQLPSTVRQADAAFVQAWGDAALALPPAGRPVPFSWRDAFSGVALPPKPAPVAVPFGAPAGVPLNLAVYPAAQPGPRPTLVVIYGGAWQRGSPSQDPQLNRYLAARGYTVIAVDYRHAPAHRFPAQLADVKAAIAFIRSHAPDYGVDPSRMAVLGRSAGAHLAMLLAYDPAAPPLRGVVNYYGPVDLAAAYRQPPIPDPIDTRAVLDAFLGASPDALPALYRQASPLFRVRSQLPPTLLIYGSRDRIVEARYGRQLAEALSAAGNIAPYIEIPWADHAFDSVFRGPSSQLALYYTERFLAEVMR